jgi:hypothetical protein
MYLPLSLILKNKKNTATIVYQSLSAASPLIYGNKIKK